MYLMETNDLALVDKNVVTDCLHMIALDHRERPSKNFLAAPGFTVSSTTQFVVEKVSAPSFKKFVVEIPANTRVKFKLTKLNRSKLFPEPFVTGGLECWDGN